MDIFLLYLWTRLDSINGFAFAALLIVAAVVIGLAITWLINAGIGGSYEDTSKASKAALFKAAKYAIVPALVLLIVPSQKDAAIIAGGWAVKQVATSEGAQQLSSKTFALINGKLDEELAKLTTKEEK